MPAKAIIEMRDVDISAGAVKLVRRLSADVSPGRVLAIVTERADVRQALFETLAGRTSGYAVGGDLVLEGREFVSRVGNATQAGMYIAAIGRNLESKARLRELADDVTLRRVGLEPSDVRANELDPESRVRAAFAAALSATPKVMVVDLPYAVEAGSTYPISSALLHDLCRDPANTFVVLTDSLAVAADVADDVVVTLDGCAVESGSVYDVCLRPAMPYVKDLVALTPRPHKEMPAYERLIDIASHQGCPWVLNCREEVLRTCSHEMPRLRVVALGHWAACHRLPPEAGARHGA